MKNKLNNHLKQSALISFCLFQLLFNLSPVSLLPWGESRTVHAKDKGLHHIVQTHHSNDIESVNFSPDGKLAVSGSRDRSIRIWDVSSNKLLRILRGHRDSVNSVVFSADGKAVYSGSRDGTIKIWNSASGKLLHTFKKQSSGVAKMILSADGKNLISLYADALRIYDPINKKPLTTRKGPSFEFEDMVLTKDERFLVFGVQKKVVLWELATRRTVKTIELEDDKIESIAVNTQGNILAIVTTTGYIKTLSLPDGKPIKTNFSSFNEMGSINFGPNGRYAAFLERSSGNVRLFDLKTKKTLIDLWVNCNIAFNLKGNMIVAGQSNFDIAFWNINSGSIVPNQRKHIESAFPVARNQKGDLLASGYRTIKIWNLQGRNKSPKLLKSHPRNHFKFIFHPDQTHLLSASTDDRVRIWNMNRGRVRKILRLKRRSGNLKDMTLSLRGKYISEIRDKKTLNTWDYKSGKLINTIKDQNLHSVVFSHDSKTLISGTYNKLLFWNVEQSKQIKSIPSVSKYCYKLTMSDDGSLFAAGDYDNTIYLNKYPGGQMIKKFKANVTLEHRSPSSIAISKNNKLIAATFHSGDLVIWDIPTGKLVKKLDGYPLSFYNSLTFLANDTVLLLGGVNLKMWRVNNWKDSAELWSFKDNSWIFSYKEFYDSADINTPYVAIMKNNKLMRGKKHQKELYRPGLFVKYLEKSKL